MLQKEIVKESQEHAEDMYECTTALQSAVQLLQDTGGGDPVGIEEMKSVLKRYERYYINTPHSQADLPLNDKDIV